MKTHYLKVAARNLFKYRTQSILSILGLAIGFACFALASLWIRHEMTYDTFHDGADRIYRVRKEEKASANGLGSVTPYPLAAYLKETFPEVEGACNLQFYESPYKVDGVELKLNELSIDSAAFSVFDIRLLEGSTDFLIPRQQDKVAITRRCAQRLFGDKSPIGKTIQSVYQKDPITICAVVSEWPEHSNLNYDIINRTNQYDQWGIASWSTYIRLTPQADAKAFSQKLYEHVIQKEDIKMEHFVATPLTAMRYDRPDPHKEASVKLKHVALFAVAGALVIFCALLNYLTLFITQIRMRGKELALRTVNGASPKSLFALLITEYLILLIWAWFFGMMFIEITFPWFKELAELKVSRNFAYAESAVYCFAVIILSILLSAFPILYYRKKSLQSVINSQKDGRGKNLFRKVSVTFQLTISVGFIFCTSVMMKQLFHLHHTDDRGMDIHNTAAVTMNSQTHIDAISDFLRSMPEVEEVAPRHNPLVKPRGSMMLGAKEWEDMPTDAGNVLITIHQEDTSFVNFYRMTLLEGEMVTASSEKNDIVLNQAAVKEFGWHKAVGKTFKRSHDGETYRVVGVVKDFHTQTPTLPAQPEGFMYHYELGGGISFYFSEKDNILFRYREGTWKTCKEKIEAMLQKEYPDSRIELQNTEEEYTKFLSSEKALLKMLGALALVCAWLSIFAIYSLVSLTCEQRRKEIAIRKVNGAIVKDILSMFAKEYFTLLGIASIIAFPVSYVIMKHWLESYTLQTTISGWLYASILMGVALVIAASIGYRVWKAANENPADVVKSE